MASRGTACWQAQTIYPPITLPLARLDADGLSAVDPRADLATTTRPEKGALARARPSSPMRAPTGLRTAMVVGKDKLNHLRLDGTLDDYEVVLGGDEPISVNARDRRRSRPAPDLLMVHLPGRGHLRARDRGGCRTQYLQQVAEADHADRPARWPRCRHRVTRSILTADHGGLGPTHGVDRASGHERSPGSSRAPDVVPNNVLRAEDVDHGHRRHRPRRLRPAHWPCGAPPASQ